MKPVLPGATVGIMGGGQLGRMLALEARRMGYKSMVLDPTPGCPAAQVADGHVLAPLDDGKAALELAAKSDVVTLEWELIPFDVLAKIEAVKPLYPSSHILRLIQDRLRQKQFLAEKGFPQTPFREVDGAPSLEDQVKVIGFPCILKRRRHGYDGKGQYPMESAAALSGAQETLKSPCVLEAKVPFRQELSVLLARGQDGGVSLFPVAENVHRGGILQTTRTPAKAEARVQNKAAELAVAIAESLDHVGTIAVEMFMLSEGSLLVNEIAPRVHNSGHFTYGACVASQFEQHLRAVLGLPLGDPSLLSPCVMVNLMGELWSGGEPRWETLLAHPQAKLHLYGKAKAAPGRKMGHVLLLGQDTDKSLALAEEILENLKPARSPQRY